MNHFYGIICTVRIQNVSLFSNLFAFPLTVSLESRITQQQNTQMQRNRTFIWTYSVTAIEFVRWLFCSVILSFEWNIFSHEFQSQTIRIKIHFFLLFKWESKANNFNYKNHDNGKRWKYEHELIVCSIEYHVIIIKSVTQKCVTISLMGFQWSSSAFCSM